MNNQEDVDEIINTETMLDVIQILFDECRHISMTEAKFSHYIAPLKKASDNNYVPNEKMFQVLCKMANHPRIKKLVDLLAED